MFKSLRRLIERLLGEVLQFVESLLGLFLGFTREFVLIDAAYPILQTLFKVGSALFDPSDRSLKQPFHLLL